MLYPPMKAILFFLPTLVAISAARADIVINEILHDSEPNTVCSEFIELVNTGPDAVDLSGWAFTSGIDFEFPQDTMIPSGGYLVVAQDPATILSLYGAQAIGPYVGALSKQGETVTLRDSGGVEIDEVSYRDAFPWPVGALGSGRSMELINPSLDNDLGSSWRASQPLGLITARFLGWGNAAAIRLASSGVSRAAEWPK